MREFAKESLPGMQIREVDHRIVAFYDNEPAKLFMISEWFQLHEKTFKSIFQERVGKGMIFLWLLMELWCFAQI